MIKNYIMYLRKSRADGDGETIAQVLEKHETILQEYSEKTFGECIPESNIYREVVSGETIADRPEMQRILGRIESGEIKGVFVVEPQRLSRGDLVDCGMIINAFRFTNTFIYTPNMVYDLSNKMERKFFEQELMRGNDYLEYTKEILNRGRIASVKKGNFIGSVAPYGYRRVQKRDADNKPYYTLEILPEEAAGVKAAYDAYVNKGYGPAKIAHYMDSLGFRPRKTDHWTTSALRDILSNPVYIGKIRWDWRKTKKVMADGEVVKKRPRQDNASCILVDGRHEPIIPEDMFNQAAAITGTRTREPKGRSLKNPFAGIIFCRCGHALVRQPYKKCDTRMVCTEQTYCGTMSCREEDIRIRVIDALERCVKDFTVRLDRNEDAPDKNADILIGLKKELDKIDLMDEEQHDLLESRIYTREVFLDRNAKLMERRKKIEASIKKLEQEQETMVDYAERIATFKDALYALKDPEATAAEQNKLLKKCIRRITYQRVGKKRTKWEDAPIMLDFDFII